MIYLGATTSKLQLVTSAAATLDVQVNWADLVLATGLPANPPGGAQNTAIVTATTTDILAAPGAANLRTLKQMTVRNKDASLACDVTVVYDAAATDTEIDKFTLNPSDCLIYIEGIGFYHRVATALLDKVIIMPADSTHATAATFADISGMTWPIVSGKKYYVDVGLYHISNATTTGAQFGYNIGAAPTEAFFGNYSGVTNSVTAGAMSLGVATARDTAITAQTTGSANITLTIIKGYIKPSADGTLAMRATSEVTVASALIVKAGSYMHIRQER